MRNKNFFAIVCCFLPLCAHAEVLDKLPQIQDMWLYAALGFLFAGVALRIHWALFVLALVYPALWFVSLLMEVHSFDLGPAIVVEAGQSYSMNAYAAAIIWLLGVVGLFVWKKIGKFAKGTTSSYKS
ncbi:MULTISPECIES: hypothetical protein [Limnobacter]|jgi:hypothetical protein|uniref:Uncharacterized protein n=1 Tax=Limnobacter profundi TaxID=2732163 RepID=A0ABX6N4L9_9BURK|nr:MULTISPECIES: hypothetical protein [unclassified Limnobacter]MDP3271104.1 hypothetical protein [Limnobacter sp.]QJR29340.1 hypothetical protein HKT17_06240 [Limnobacter sp. SAORIC-580]